MHPATAVSASSASLERDALVQMSPKGFKIRHPPSPHELDSFITPNERLFLTMHMGAAVVDSQKYRLVVDGLVNRPLSLALDELMALPRVSVTAMHECYGSPLKPATEALWRIGNVHWTGVQLSYLLQMAGYTATDSESFVWSEGLDRGTFAGTDADCYQKDLPISKALKPEVIVAYLMNGHRLDKERGGPVRLVVPGWFGTNSTKWLSKLSVQRHRATGPYTTTFYNEVDPTDPEGKLTKPVWNLEVNSMITRPKPNEVLAGPSVDVQGWAWSDEGIAKVMISPDEGLNWIPAFTEERKDYEWQRFQTTIELSPGLHSLMARATCRTGHSQPQSGRRNHVHHLNIEVKGP